MSRIRVDDLHKDWMKDPEYRREYEALEEEFARAAALITTASLCPTPRKKLLK